MSKAVANDSMRHFMTDLKVELLDVFDKNFERKGFFDRPWKETKFPNKRGSLMLRSGALRASLKGNVAGSTIVFSSSLPYARIQNEGGLITVTEKMKKFFWAMFYKSVGAAAVNAKTGKMRNTARNRSLATEAGYWRGLALKKVGSKIKIEARPFVGSHPHVGRIIAKVFDDLMKEQEVVIKNKLKP